MMDQLISRFPDQLEEALQISFDATIHKHTHPINKVFVAGLGGSGIGADFVASFIKDESKVPYLVGKGYKIPAYVDQNTLAIASSYSGNTEETLTSFEQFLKTGAKVVVISSGGKLVEAAINHKFDFIRVPGHWPSPRACLGYSVVTQLALLNKLDVISDIALDQIAAGTNLIRHELSDIQSKAKDLAETLSGSMPVIYTSDRMEPVAVRLRQQINENAKKLCWHHVFPEMNHNELVGWKGEYQNISVVMLRNDDDSKRNSARMDICQGIFEKHANKVVSLYSKGRSLIERSLYFIHLGDWTSWYLSEMAGVDAIEVDVIDYLKKELSSL